MSTAGILRPDEVVFYHPLDSFVEHTQSQSWNASGSTGGFTTGKLPGGSPAGLSAVAGDAVSWAAADVVDDTMADYANAIYNSVAVIDSTKVLVVYGGDTELYARVCAISGTTVTVGTVKTLTSGIGTQQREYYAQAVHLSGGKCVIATYVSGGGYFMVADVSGMDVTVGAAVQMPDAAPKSSKPRLDALDTDRFICLGDSSAWPAFIYVGQVSGTDITFGPATRNHYRTYSGHAGIHRLSSDKAVVIWDDFYGDSPSQYGLIGSVLTISGTSSTIGPMQVLWSGTGYPDAIYPDWYAHRAVGLSADKFVAIFTKGYAANKGPFVSVVSVSGTDMTSGALHTPFGHPSNGYALGARISSDSFVAMCTDNGGSPASVIGTVSGSAITWGSTSFSNLNNHPNYVDVKALDSTHMIQVSPDGYSPSGGGGIGTIELDIGVLDSEARALSSTPAAYPVADGDDRVVVAMWAKDVTKGSSSVVVQRDYKITLTGTTITLGTASAEWAGLAMMGTGAGQMNDGSDHLLVLDFEHTGAGSWTLRTSVDGAAWTNQGAGTGTQSTTTGNGDAKIEILSGESGQWVDEAVLWSGDKSTFPLFTTEELANLNDLADTFGESMDKYEENYGAPICWQATATMPDGTVWRDSGSGPCPAVIRVPRGAADIVVTDEGRRVHPRVQEG